MIRRLLVTLLLVPMGMTVATMVPTQAAGGFCALNSDLMSIDASCDYRASDVLTALGTPPPNYKYRVEPICEAADPGQSLCIKPTMCIDPPDTYRFRVYRSINNRPFEFIGFVCFDDDQAGQTDTLNLGQITHQFKRLTWPKPELVVQPPDGRTLVNFPTNFYTTATQPITQTVTLLGRFKVDIQATPVRYIWHFGDTDPITGTNPGAPFEEGKELQVSHEYEQSDTTYTPSLDVVLKGRARVNGGAWITLRGTITIPGDPQDLEVVSATPHLVG